MAGQIDIVVTKQAQAEVDKLLGSLKSTYEEIIKVNQNAIKFNGQTAPKNPTNLKKQTEELTAVEKEREKVLKQLEVTNSKLAIANENNTKQLNNQKTALKTLNSAYLQLAQREAESARRVQDLIARGKTATQTQKQYNTELRNAQKEFDRYRAKVLEADKAVGRWNRTGERSIGFMRNLIGAFGIAGGVTLFATIARDIFQTTKELQSLDNALKQVSGSQEQFSRSQAFLREISEAFGLEINGLTRQFTQFYVSAKDKLSGTEIENIFTSISKAGAVMGLSVDNQNRAFLALNQMMSKGTIQAEELRGQLAEALPGAFGIMAKAVGVTEKELQNMMKSGSLLADEVLPKFARELEKVYGIETITRVETLSASTNRLSNSWTEFVRSLNESETGGISRFFKFMVDGLNDILNLLLQANKDFKEIQKEVGSSFYENEKKQVFEFAKMSADIAKKRFTTEKEYLDRIRELEVKDAKDRLFRAENVLQELKLKQEDVAFTLNIEKQESKNIITGGIFNLSDLNKAKKAFEENSLAISNTQQRILALKDIIKGDTQIQEENTKAVDGNTKKIKENTKAKKDKIEADKYSITWFKRNITALENEHKLMSFGNPLRKQVIAQLVLLKQAYELLYGEKKKNNDESKKELEYGTIAFYENEIKLLREMQQLTKDNERYSSLQRDIDFYQVLIDRIKGVNKSLEEGKVPDYSAYFEGFIEEFSSNSGFSKTIDIMSGKIEGFGEDAKVTALAVSDAFQQAFNTISEFSNANYEQMYRNLEQQRDVAILFAGESTTAREEIERQYEERRKRIQRQQAESQKRLAMFNIVTDTAQAIMATFAKSGFKAGLPLAIAMGAIGLVQLKMVASQPIPAFEKGGIHDGGLMLVNDGKGSNYAEKVVTPDGKVHSPKGRNVVMNAPKGTEIFTHDQWQNQMNNILLGNGIGPMQANNYQGLTKSDLEDVMSRNLNKDSYHFSIDEGGINKTIMRGSSKTTILNSRLRIKSNNV